MEWDQIICKKYSKQQPASLNGMTDEQFAGYLHKLTYKHKNFKSVKYEQQNVSKQVFPIVQMQRQHGQHVHSKCGIYDSVDEQRQLSLGDMQLSEVELFTLSRSFTYSKLRYRSNNVFAFIANFKRCIRLKHNNISSVCSVYSNSYAQPYA